VRVRYSVVAGYGPTILVDVRDHEALLKLRHVFAELSRRKTTAVDLLKENFVVASGLSELHLECVDDGQERTATVRRVNDGSVLSFRWARDAEGWLECAELLDAFMDSGMPGHQYLGEGDAVVEVDFMEHTEAT